MLTSQTRFFAERVSGFDWINIKRKGSRKRVSISRLHSSKAIKLTKNVSVLMLISKESFVSYLYILYFLYRISIYWLRCM